MKKNLSHLNFSTYGKLALTIILSSIFCNVFSQGKDTLIGMNENVTNFDYNRPVFELNTEQLSNTNGLLRFSVLTKYREGVESVRGTVKFNTYIDEKHHTTRFYMMNLSIVDMLSLGFAKKNRVILEVKDPDRYQYKPSSGSKIEWMRKNAYCFEYLIPYGAMKSTQLIKDELAHHFNVTFGNYIRPTKVLVLKNTSPLETIKAKNNKIEGTFKNSTLTTMSLDMLSKVTDDAGLPPIINEANYQGNVDINVGLISTIESLRKALKGFNLDVKLETRDIEMLVIKENSK